MKTEEASRKGTRGSMLILSESRVDEIKLLPCYLHLFEVAFEIKSEDWHIIDKVLFRRSEKEGEEDKMRRGRKSFLYVCRTASCSSLLSPS